MAVSIATLQKRARDKEYRLRKQGATFDEVRAASPRVPAKDIAKMTPGQKRSYRAKLERFNSRDNRLSVLESGEILKHADLAKFQKRVKSYNDKVERTRVQLERKAQKQGFYKGKTVKNESAISGIKFLNATAKPKSKEQFRAFKRGFERLKKTSEVKRRQMLRQNAKAALCEVGLSDVAKQIDKLNNNAFDMLMTYTDFWGAVNSVYVEADVSLGHVDSASYKAHAGNIIFAISQSQKIK